MDEGENYLIFQILKREAELLIGGTTPATKPTTK
jgi:hypothetical protein